MKKEKEPYDEKTVVAPELRLVYDIFLIGVEVVARSGCSPKGLVWFIQLSKQRSQSLFLHQFQLPNIQPMQNSFRITNILEFRKQEKS